MCSTHTNIKLVQFAGMKREGDNNDIRGNKRIKLSPLAWNRDDIKRALSIYCSSCEGFIPMNEITPDPEMDDCPFFMSHGLKLDKETQEWTLVDFGTDLKGDPFTVEHFENDVLRILVLGVDSASITSPNDLKDMLKTSAFYAVNGETFCYAVRRLYEENGEDDEEDDDEDDDDMYDKMFSHAEEEDSYNWLNALCTVCEFSWNGCPERISEINEGEYYTQLQPLALTNAKDVFNAAYSEGVDFVNDYCV